MIRTLLATTAIATLITGGAIAQTTTPSDPAATPDTQQTEMRIHAEGLLASELIGESVYNGTSAEAENIGEITDLVILQDGSVDAIVVGVGGFLGIGQKEVALQYDLAEWVEQADGERWVVVETTRDALEGLPEFDRSAYRPMPADAEVAVTPPATSEDLASVPGETTQPDGEIALAPTPVPSDGASRDTGQDLAAGDPSDATDQQIAETEPQAERPVEDGQQAAQTDQPMEDQQQTAQTDAETDQTLTGAIDPSQLQEAQPDQIRAEELTGTAVYGSNDERIGEIGDVILTPEGDVDAVIVDVGGFLGIGEKEVAIGMDNLTFMTDEGGDYYLFTEFTQEQLEAAPEFNEASYAEQRDEMRLRVQ